MFVTLDNPSYYPAINRAIDAYIAGSRQATRQAAMQKPQSSLAAPQVGLPTAPAGETSVAPPRASEKKKGGGFASKIRFASGLKAFGPKSDEPANSRD